MPNIVKNSKNMLIFDNAYVNQPRSCKTMSSLMLGTYPDPNLDSIAWHYDLIKNPKESFPYKLLDNGYELYFGTLQENEGGDEFGNFLRKLSNNKITIEDQESFLAKQYEIIDERLLTDGLLHWIDKQNGNFAAFLWTKSAHMPYASVFDTFGKDTKLNKYDNCLLNIDNSFKNLIDGLKKRDKLKNTLIVLFGDHGEAVGVPVDWGHGNFLYDHSIRIPFMIYNSEIFHNEKRVPQRFQIKDISSTILFLLGLDSNLHQSENIFSKSKTDTIYLSNVYQDFKLGMVYDKYKFVFRPQYDITYLYDINDDEVNIINKITKEKVDALKYETLQWYKYQREYIKKNIY
jgi:membrane-anchored protein YejM (alkaline phosphatase superfamily)